MSQRVLSFVVTVAVVTGGALLARQAPSPNAPPRTPAQTVVVSPADHWRHAVDAWDAGQYPAALRDLTDLMKSQAAAEYRDRVALLTGEVFVTTELTTDGRNPKISPNGQYAAYEASVPGAESDTVTHLVRLTATGAQPVAVLAGVNLAFDASGTQAVYLRPQRTPSLVAAMKQLDAATLAGGPAAERQNLQAQIAWALASASDVVVRDLAAGTERVVPTGDLLKSAPMFAADRRSVLFIGADQSDLTRSDLYRASDAGAPVKLTDQPGHKSNVLIDPSGAALVYVVTGAAPFRFVNRRAPVRLADAAVEVVAVQEQAVVPHRPAPRAVVAVARQRPARRQLPTPAAARAVDVAATRPPPALASWTCARTRHA